MTNTEFRNIRHELGLSQEAFSRRIGVSIDLVRKIEQGKDGKNKRAVTAETENKMRLAGVIE